MNKQAIVNLIQQLKVDIFSHNEEVNALSRRLKLDNTRRVNYLNSARSLSDNVKDARLKVVGLHADLVKEVNKAEKTASGLRVSTALSEQEIMARVERQHASSISMFREMLDTATKQHEYLLMLEGSALEKAKLKVQINCLSVPERQYINGRLDGEKAHLRAKREQLADLILHLEKADIGVFSVIEDINTRAQAQTKKEIKKASKKQREFEKWLARKNAKEAIIITSAVGIKSHLDDARVKKDAVYQMR